MTASPLVAGIEAIAAGHRAAGVSAVERYRAERSIYLEWDLAMQARLQRLKVEIAEEYEAERVAWADAKSAESSERMERRKAS